MKTFIASIIISVLAPLYALCQESPDSAACRRKFDEALKMREDYEFDKAAAILENLKASCGNDSCIMLKADSLLLQAKNGKSMIEFASSPVTVASTDVPAREFYLYYGCPDGAWKKMPEKISKGISNEYYDSVYFPEGADEIFFSMPGKDGKWTICHSRNIEGNVWSAPEPVFGDIRSGGNDIFPIISKDGKFLFFSSDGFYGMGGYDLYVCERDMESGEWGIPQNMGFPYSSPADDLLFMNSGELDFFSSDRDTGNGMLRVYALEPANDPVKRAITPSYARKAAKLVPSGQAEKESYTEPDQPEFREHSENSLYDKYFTILRKADSLQSSIDSISKILEADRNLYSNSTNPDDRLFLSKRIAGAESMLMQANSCLYSESSKMQALETEMINSGMEIPKKKQEAGMRNEDGTKEQPVMYAFSKKRISDFPGIEMLKAEPEKDYTLKKGKTSEILDNSELPDGLYYQVQLFLVSREATSRDLKGISPVFKEKTRTGKYIYRAGIFKTYEEAAEGLAFVKRNGIPGAMIAAFFNHETVSANRARELEKTSGAKPCQVVLGMFQSGIPSQILDEIRKTCNKDIAKTNENGRTLYVIGPFPSRNEAGKLMTVLDGLAVEGAFIREM